MHVNDHILFASPYRCSEITVEKTPRRAQNAEDDLDILAGVGVEGVRVDGVKVTVGRRVLMAGGRRKEIPRFSFRWVVRML